MHMCILYSAVYFIHRHTVHTRSLTRAHSFILINIILLFLQFEKVYFENLVQVSEQKKCKIKETFPLNL